MTERDELDRLTDLAREGEEYATPWPAERVRQLGARRRTRRYATTVAAAVVTVLVAGSVAVGSGVLRTDTAPDPVATPTAIPSATEPTSPTPTPSPVRTVTETNLIKAGSITKLGKERYTETAPELGRRPAEVTACLRNSQAGQLRATATVNRNFRLDRRYDGERNPPAEPFRGDPTVYTQAMQFDSADTAEQAYLLYRGWLIGCQKTIKARGAISGAASDWTSVTTTADDAQAGFSEITWHEADDESGSGYFESVGLALVDDRLAVTVWLVYGQDYNVSYLQDGDPDAGLPAHPQFGLVIAATKALAR